VGALVPVYKDLRIAAWRYPQPGAPGAHARAKRDGHALAQGQGVMAGLTKEMFARWKREQRARDREMGISEVSIRIPKKDAHVVRALAKVLLEAYGETK
jgi:hypothetical protein